MTDDNTKSLSLWLALVPLAALMVMLALSVTLFGDESSSGPNQIALLLAAGVAKLIGWRRGIAWSDLEKALVDGISHAMAACLILLAIGALIGSWMLAGTAPALIYHGLGLLNPSWFYPAAAVICALVSLTIGSSWTTAGTVGIALIGVAHVMGLSSAIAAGAIISGAYFGDKMSPLSDTTNLAPAMAGTDLFTHIRHMTWTTIPSILIALALFTWLSPHEGSITVAGDGITATRALLAQQFSMGLPAFLPLALVLGMAVKKYPAYPTIIAGALAGAIIAVIYQPGEVRHFADPSGELGSGLALLKGVWQALATGYIADTGNAALDTLLSRGGMASMLNTVWLIITAMIFGASMERTGFLKRITRALISRVRGTGSLIFTTVLTSIGMNIAAADQYMAIVLPGRMYRVEFARRGLAPQNLSRTLEDAGTMTSALIPWNTCGAFMAATLGVPTLVYLPFAFMNIMNPVIAIIYGMANFKITPLADPFKPAEAATPASSSVNL